MRKLTDNDFKKQINLLSNGKIIPLEKYLGDKISIKFKHICEDCNNHEFYAQPNDLKNSLKKGNYGCPECANKHRNDKYRKSLEQFKNEMNDKYGNKYTVLGNIYKDTNTPILIRHNCEDCNNHEWKIRPNDILNCNHECPICNKANNSKGCKKINNYLLENNIIFEREKIFNSCKRITYLPFDFYIENLNLLIEFDGQQHFKRKFNSSNDEFELQKIRDLIKNEWCKSNNTDLLRIPFSMIKNIELILNFTINKNYNELKKIKNIYFCNNEIIIKNGFYK